MHVLALAFAAATILIAAAAKPPKPPPLFAVKVGKQVVQAYPIGHGDFRDCRNHKIPRSAITGKPRPLLGRCAPIRRANVSTPRASAPPGSVSSPALTPPPPALTPTPHSVATPAARTRRGASNGEAHTPPESIPTSRSEPTPAAVQTPGKFMYRRIPDHTPQPTPPGHRRQPRMPRPLPTRTP